jgi:hypothetical protein
MKIDWSKFSDESAGPAVHDRTPLSPGQHHGVIDTVEEKPGWRIDSRNPTGDCISIWTDFIENGVKKRVFSTIAWNWTAKLIEVAECAGVPGPQRGQTDWDEQELVGCKVFVETNTYIQQKGKDAGQEKASIEKWLPAPRVEAKLKPVSKHGDDIPF